MIELESGNVGLVDDIQSEDFERVDSDPRFDLIDAGGIAHWMSFNVTKAPFDDLRVRQAIYAGINREAVSEIVAGRYGKVIPTIVHPSEFVYDDSIDIYAHDPEKAKALLAEAGFSAQKPLRFNLSMIQREPDNTIAQIVQAQLAEIGVELNIQQLERQAFIDEWQGKRHDVGLARVDLPRGDPDQSFYPFFGRTAAQRTGEGDPVLFDLIDKGRITLDQDARKQVYVEAQKRLLEIAHYVWIFMREAKHASTTKLENLAVSPVKTWYLDEAWLDQ
jgi:peptide/nickel transport system substrate-binding protein